MNSSRPKHELLLTILILFLAMAFRLILLGSLPLSDSEAEWALQALHISQGTRPLLGPQPIYVIPTSLLFFLFGSTNFLARLIPALTGSALVFIPYIFRERLKPTVSLLLTLFLALDPGLISLSRQAGSLIPALTFTLLGWAFWWKARPRLAGVSAGLALLSGPALWTGVLGLGLTWLILHKLDSGTTGSEDEQDGKADRRATARGAIFEPGSDPYVAALFGGLTILIGGTLFFISPNGLSAWLTSLPVYLGGWARPSGVSAGRLLLALVIYQPLALLLGLVTVVRGWRQGYREPIRLSIWFLVTLLLVLLYPARQVGDLAWAVVPLWVLAGMELSKHIKILPRERREVSGVVLLVVLLLVFTYLDFAGIALDPQNPVNLSPNGVQVGGWILIQNLPPTRYLLLISVLLLLAVSILLVALGWSVRTAQLGAVWGAVVVLGVYSLGIAWGATGLRTPGGWELWYLDKQPLQADLLLTTVNDLSEWSTGDALAQEVTLYGVDSPAIQWLLRGRVLHVVEVVNPQWEPPIVITPQSDSLDLPASYRGQDFTWRREPIWSILNVYDWMKWSIFRNLPYESETVIVWGRGDLFLGGRGSLP